MEIAVQQKSDKFIFELNKVIPFVGMLPVRLKSAPVVTEHWMFSESTHVVRGVCTVTPGGLENTANVMAMMSCVYQYMARHVDDDIIETNAVLDHMDNGNMELLSAVGRALHSGKPAVMGYARKVDTREGPLYIGTVLEYDGISFDTHLVVASNPERMRAVALMVSAYVNPRTSSVAA